MSDCNEWEPTSWLGVAGRGACGVARCDGGVPGAPWLTVAEDIGEPYLHLPWPAFTDGERSLDANDFNFSAGVAWIMVVQNLAGFEHDASRANAAGPSSVRRRRMSYSF